MSSSGIRTNENDVLLGRGGNNHSHCGNDQLRRIAHGRVGEYIVARIRKDKDTTEVVLATTFGREEEASKTKEKQQRGQIYSNSEDSDDQIKMGGGL
jgi:hypothetical protein